MTILPRASSRRRPSANLLAQELAPCNLNRIFFPGYTVVASVRTRESLTLKLEATEPAICPRCGEPCTKIHDTRCRLVRDAPFPGVTMVWLLVPIRRVRYRCGCHRTETIPWIAHHEQCTNRFIALIQNQMRGQDASTTGVAAKYNLGWDAVRRFDKEQLEALFKDVNTRDLRIIAVDEIAIHKGQRYATIFLNYETRQVFAVVEGKTKKAVESVFRMLVDRGLQDQIIAVACDMNAAYPAVVKKFLPKAEIVFDQFHVIQRLSADVHQLQRCGVMGLLHRRLDPVLPDRGQVGKVRYSAAELIRMRLLALMVGREDLNDAQTLADDPGFAMAFGRKDLPSTATLCRFERKIDNRVIEAGNQFLLDMYFRYGFKRKYVFIDVDNTPVPLYGHQELVKFNGHYRYNCYLPLLAFIDGFPVAVFNGNADGRKIMAAQFRQMVERIRERSPKSIVILRADRGFNSRALIDL